MLQHREDSKHMTHRMREARHKRPQSGWSHFDKESRIGKSIETERLVVARGWREGGDC